MDKYYTPDASEFHIGFRYQSGNRAGVGTSNKWFDEVFQDGGSCYDTHEERRVKYLDKADIEELGFNLYEDKFEWEGAWVEIYELRINPCGDWEDCIAMQDDVYHLYYQNNANGVKITIKCMNYWDHKDNTLFRGRIKNYNELERLMKQLNIIK